MNIKAKKHNPDGLVRVETSGQIKEVLVNQDILKPNETIIQLCFRGKSSSGIVELSAKEFQNLSRDIEPKLNLLKGKVKVLKFEK